MWSSDPKVQSECTAKIQTVASEPDAFKRYELALREIAAGMATLPDTADRSAWAGTLAMYALHPESLQL